MKFSSIVIGLGNIGLTFDLEGDKNTIFSHTKAYMKSNNFNLIAGIDKDQKKQNEFKEYSSAKTFSDINSFKKEFKQVDVISICTPTHIRLSLFKEVLTLNPKLIIIEKPIATTIKEANEIKELASRRKIKLYINYMRRVEPFFMNIKNTLQSTNVKSITVNYTNGLYTNASHFIDLMHYFFGMEKKIQLISLQKMEKDYNATFVLYYENFHVVFIGLDNLDYSLGTVDIIQKDSRILIKDWGFEVDYFDSVEDPLFPELKMLQKKELELYPNMQEYMSYVMKHIYNILNDDESIISSIDSSIETLTSCEEIKNASNL